MQDSELKTSFYLFLQLVNTYSNELQKYFISKFVIYSILSISIRFNL